MIAGKIRLSRPPRFLIAGCYGEENTGDEALLQSTVALLRARWPDAEVAVFSDQPAQTARAYAVASLPGVGWLRLRTAIGLLRRGDLFRIFRAIGRCDCLLLGGGELLRTDRGAWGVLSIFDRVLLAQLLQKPVIMLGLGAGRLDPGFGLRLMARCARRSQVFVRDAESVSRLRQAGVDGAEVMPDLAFQLRPGGVPPELGLPPGPLVAFSMLAPFARMFDGSSTVIGRERFAERVAAAADRVASLGGRPVFLPFCCGDAMDDREIHREIVARMRRGREAVVIEKRLAPEDVLAVLEAVDLVVAMRLHACILGLNARRPVLAVAYDAKVRKVLSDLGLQEWVLPLQEFDALEERVEWAWRSRRLDLTPLRGRIEEGIAAFRRRFYDLFQSS